MGILKYCGGPPAGRKSLSITALSIRSSVHDSLSTHMCTSEWCSFTSWWLSTRRKKAMSPKWWPTRRRASGFSSPRSLPHFAVTVISPSSSRTNWSTTSPYVITTSPLVCFVSRKPFATRLASTSSRSSKMAHRRRIFRLRARRSSCHSRSDSLSKPRAIAYSTLSSSMTTLRWLLESMSASSPKVSPVRITSPTLWPCFTLPSSIGGDRAILPRSTSFTAALPSLRMKKKLTSSLRPCIVTPAGTRMHSRFAASFNASPYFPPWASSLSTWPLPSSMFSNSHSAHCSTVRSCASFSWVKPKSVPSSLPW